MEKVINQSVSQYNVLGLDKRLIVQFSEGEMPGQIIVNYDDLTTEQKAVFDSYQTLCESLLS